MFLSEALVQPTDAHTYTHSHTRTHIQRSCLSRWSWFNRPRTLGTAPSATLDIERGSPLWSEVRLLQQVTRWPSFLQWRQLHRQQRRRERLKHARTQSPNHSRPTLDPSFKHTARPLMMRLGYFSYHGVFMASQALIIDPDFDIQYLIGYPHSGDLCST